MTDRDPLSPSSLAQVPEVRKEVEALQARLLAAKEGESINLEPFLLAVRDATLRAERDRLRGALEQAEGIVRRFVKARDAFHYDNFGGEVERHLERAMEDAYGFLHGLPDDLRAALGAK